MKPKPACVIGGEPWWNWLYSYEFDGKRYEFPICARSRDEADARLKKIALARLDGQQCGVAIPLLRGGFLVPMIVWWRNWRKRNERF